MSVRKRIWTTAGGEEKSAWLVDYRDGRGARRQKTFARKKEADAFAATANVEVRQGVHVADADTVTVAQAGAFWIASATAAGLERATVTAYQSNLKLHIVPFLGMRKVSALTIPAVRAFEDDLRAAGRSPAMVRKILVSLGSILADAHERGLTARNVVRDIRGRRGRGERRQEQRHKAKLRSGWTSRHARRSRRLWVPWRAAGGLFC